MPSSSNDNCPQSSVTLPLSGNTFGNRKRPFSAKDEKSDRNECPQSQTADPAVLGLTSPQTDKERLLVAQSP
jgi:hypothetical protein